MTTPTVTELPRRIEPTTRDTFIDGMPADVSQVAPGRLVSRATTNH